MKINHKNTALGLLSNMNAQAFRIIDDGGGTTREQKTNMGLSLVREWHKMRDRFAAKVQYISEPFYAAYNRGAHKLVSVLDKEPINSWGTFISSPSASETNTIFYHVHTFMEDGIFKMEAFVLFFNSHTHKDKPALAMLVHRYKDGKVKEYFSKKSVDAGLTDMSVCADIFSLILFMKYCEIETKVIQANKKGNHAGVKYVNETRSNIEILDSTWFTTLVKSEGFTVGADTGGFFKMQPYGPGNSQRKLIWVLPYEKEGYTRTAKVLMQNEK